MTTGQYVQRGRRMYRDGNAFVISVREATYTKAQHIRDALGLATLGEVVELVTRSAARAAGSTGER